MYVYLWLLLALQGNGKLLYIWLFATDNSLMGIGLDLWRCSIGLFHCKSISQSNTSRYMKNFLIVSELSDLFLRLIDSLPFLLFIGVVKIFVFCSITLLIITLMLMWLFVFNIICTINKSQYNVPLRYSFGHLRF